MIAGILSVAIIGGAYTYISAKLVDNTLMTMINWKLIEFREMFNLILTVYLGLGIGIGVIGSSISIKKYLEV